MDRKKIITLAVSAFFAASLAFAPGKKIGDAFLPTKGKINLIVVLMSFPDMPPKTSPQEVERMLFSRGQLPAGSVADYYSEVSKGQVAITGKVFGWFSASQPASFYNGAGFGHGPGLYPKNAARLAEEAVEFAAQAGADFAEFDNAQEGAVNGLALMFSGIGGQFGGNKSRLGPSLNYVSMEGAKPIFKNGVKIDRFIMVNELNAKGVPDFVAAFCHELGHGFGLPDLWDWTGISIGLGKFDLMGIGVYGGGKAFWPSAWSRAYLGWADAQEIRGSGKYELKPAEKGGEVYKISTSRAGEYFLLENREPVGSDTGLFGKGLVIYRVDENVLTAEDRVCIGLCPGYHYLVSVEQADGLNQLERKQNSGDAADFFPGANEERNFSDATGAGADLMEGAHARLWDGELTGIRINKIKTDQDKVAFKVKLNQPSNPTPAETNLKLHGFQIKEVGDDDGLLAPGESLRLIPTISNQGAKASGIILNLSAPGLNLENEEMKLAKPLKPGAQVEAIPGFTVKVPDSWRGTQEVELNLKIESRLPVFSKDEKIKMVIGKPETALVMDDDGLGLKKYYEGALQGSGKIFHLIEIKNDLPSKELLEQFSLIIWVTGVRGFDGKAALDPARQELLSGLIGDGKNMLLISPGLALEENSELAERLGIKSTRPSGGVSAIKNETAPGPIMPLASFYFPALNPGAAIDPADDTKVLYRNLRDEPIAVSAKKGPATAVLVSFPLEAANETLRANLLKELIPVN